ncbi:MAG: CotH kinase family protein, partial [Bacilli bacterium]
IEAGVKVRGNYTANYEKKPLRIKFNKKQKMLGLNQDAKAKSWVLLADYKDSSLLRNALSFYLGNTILSSDDYYSADFIPVNVTINNEYWGMYLLTEQQQINEYRVKIDDVEDRDDYQGNDIGYFFEYDGYYTEEKEDPTFKIKYQNHASYQTYQKNWVQPTQDGYTIKSTINSDSQKSFINNYLNNIYNICYQAIEKSSFREFTLNYTGINPSPIKDCEKVVSQVIDIDSLVDMYLLQELACDADIGWSSFYLSVDMSDSGNKLLTFQAPWDFDSAFGLKKNIVESAKGMYASESTNPWMSLFMKCSWFQKRVSAKWAELVKYKIFDKTIEMIDTYPVKYEESYKNNFKRWPNSIGSNSSDEVRDDIRSLKTEKECSLQLKNWYKDRISYLNSIFAA